MRDLLRVGRQTFRNVIKSPGLCIAVLTLTLSIGANVVVFAVVNAVLFRPLPFSRADELVDITIRQSANEAASPRRLSASEFLDYGRRTQAVSNPAAERYDSFSLVLPDRRPTLLWGSLVTPNIFQTLKVHPAMGRAFLPTEGVPGNDHVAILSDRLWKQQFDGDPGVIGREIHLNGKVFTIVGVMPPGFQSSVANDQWPDEVLLPLAFSQEMLAQNAAGDFQVIGRLKTGLPVARAEAASIGTQLARLYAAGDRKEQPGLAIQVVRLHDSLTETSRRALVLLWLAVTFVMLIASSNVSNLLLSRSAGRQTEFAVRSALGASTRHLIQLIMSESLLVALIGCAAGILLGYSSLNFVRGLNRFAIPLLDQSQVDGRVVAFAITVSLLSCLLSSALPVFRTIQDSLFDQMGRSTRGAVGNQVGLRLQALLIVSQFAISLTLLSAAWSAMGSLIRSVNTDLGVNPSRVLTAWLTIPESRYPTGDLQASFYRRVLDKLAATPGISSASLIDFPPVGWRGNESCYATDERPLIPDQGCNSALIRYVTPSYFKTLSIPILSGRDFSTADKPGGEAGLVISRSLAEKVFPRANPIGRHMKTADGTHGRVVGVVGDTSYSVQVSAPPTIYFSYFQFPTPWQNLLVRTESAHPERLLPFIQEQIWSVDSQLAVYLPKNMGTMEERMATALAYPALITKLLSVFAAVAFLLTGVGVFGVVAHWISRRTEEFGVRMALGATPGDIFKLVSNENLKITLAGVGFGLIGGITATHYLAHVMYGIHPNDPFTFIAVAFSIVAISLVATWLPALRAARVDPMTVLRKD